MAGLEESLFSIPEHFTRPPPILDSLVTETSSHQLETVAECLPHLNGTADPSRNPFDFNEHGVLLLYRQEHIGFLHQSLEEFPAAFVGVDASRPWMVYWALMGLYLLGEDVTHYRDRLVLFRHQSDFLPAPNPLDDGYLWLTVLPGLSKHSLPCKMLPEV